MITAISKEGLKRRAIYNDSVLLVSKDDSVSFSFKDTAMNIDRTFNFKFSDEGEEFKTTGNVSTDGKVINLTLFKWNNSLGTEVTTPIELTLENQKKIWVKFRTTADLPNSFRSFHLTVWVEES